MNPEQSNPEPTDVTRAVTLEWERWVQARTIPTELGLDFQALQAGVFPMLYLRISRDLLSKRMAPTTRTARTEVPASWWDHFKQDHGARWLGPVWMRYRPARVVTRTVRIDIDHRLAYPEAQIVRRPGLGPAVFIDTPGPQIWSEG